MHYNKYYDDKWASYLFWWGKRNVCVIKQVVQKSCGCPIIGNVQGQFVLVFKSTIQWFCDERMWKTVYDICIYVAIEINLLVRQQLYTLLFVCIRYFKNIIYWTQLMAQFASGNLELWWISNINKNIGNIFRRCVGQCLHIVTEDILKELLRLLFLHKNKNKQYLSVMFSKTVTQLSNLFKKNFEECNLSAVLAVQVDCISK